MARNQKRNKQNGLRTLGQFLDQNFLVLVAVMSVCLLSLTQMHPPQEQPANDNSFQRYQAQGPRPDNRKPGQTRPAPITERRGVAQPINIEPGQVAVFNRLPITDPVVFVTIDDGWVQTKENLNWLGTRHLPFTMFLSDAGIRNDYQYYLTLQSAGMAVQNHTISHPFLPKLSPEAQKAEICGASDIFENVFKHRPILFRPPYGEYTEETRRIVGECGMKAIVLWSVVLDKGVVQFREPNIKLQPGDIILAHFKQDFVANMNALSQQLNQDHLQVGQLEDWIK